MAILIFIFIFLLCIYLLMYLTSIKETYVDRNDDVYTGRKSFKLGNKTIPFTDPDLIKMVLNQNDYSSEKKMVSYSDMTKLQNSPRFFLNEHRQEFIEDVPFSPHVILNSYDDVDVSSKIKLPDADDEDLDNIDELDRYDQKTFENEDDYCIRNKHLLECVLSERNYKCFGKVEFTKTECEAETDLIGNRVTPGVWDRRCVANEDCPFYKANKNYPNTFGKCNNDGYCELPKGLVRVGYRSYEKNSLPYCYNCLDKKSGKKIVDKCCSKQKNPDYMFENDVGIRYKNRKQLEGKGLLTITNDSYEKEFRALEKKFNVKN
jgi:hypothetical protein